MENDYGGLRQKSWDCQDSSDNALHQNWGRLPKLGLGLCPRTFGADLRKYFTLPYFVIAAEPGFTFIRTLVSLQF